MIVFIVDECHLPQEAVLLDVRANEIEVGSVKESGEVNEATLL